jgi:Uma2 family endonuclease
VLDLRGVSSEAPRSKIPLTAPTEAEWRALTPEAREQFLIDAIDSLNDPASLMSEGRPHTITKGRAVDLVSLHFESLGRVLYVADDLAVVYPGEPVLSPDILAVLDVPQPDDDQRLAWVVADEGRGPDLVIEVLHHGDRKKDLVDNVARYARLGIPEYFVYDHAQQRIHGFRLPVEGARRYERIVPQVGRYRSNVLGLDFAFEAGRLRIFHGSAELYGSTDLITRLEGMLNDVQSKAELAQTEADEARSEAEEARSQAEEARSEAAEARAKAVRASGALRTALLALLEARRLAVTEEVRRCVHATTDLDVLERWLLRAATADDTRDLLDD